MVDTKKGSASASLATLFKQTLGNYAVKDADSARADSAHHRAWREGRQPVTRKKHEDGWHKDRPIDLPGSDQTFGEDVKMLFGHVNTEPVTPMDSISMQGHK